MDQDVMSVVEAARSHAWMLLAWGVLTAIVNTVFHYATPVDVDAWAERNPFVAKVAALFRRLGFEPVAALTLIASFFSGRPPPPGPLGRRPKAPAPPSVDAQPNDLRSALATSFFVSICAFALWIASSLMGCAALKGANAPIVNSAVCIETEAVAGHSVATIAVNCGSDIAQVIVALLESKRETPAKHEALKARATLATSYGACQ